MRRRSVIFGFVCLSLIIIGLPNSSAQEIIFSEDFESGCVGWYADNGVWECGTPTNGPGQCYAGTGCAGTILDGNYPNNIDSRFIYALPHIPAIQLPEVTAEEEIHLRFQQWFSYYPYLPHSKDTAQVQVQVYDEGTGWSAWQDIDDWQQDRSGGWSLKSVELTEYAGLKVRVGFSHSADPAYADLGWYIDDVQVIKKVPTFTVDFGYGWSDWYADNGVWEVGSPNSAPAECLSKYRMAGTLLNKNYPDYTDSRLISPTFRLPPADSGDSFYLKFNHWWSHASGDYGQVEVSSQDDITGEWSEWKQPSIVIPTKVEGVSGTCQDGYAYLTEYAGKNVRIVFHHITDTSYGSFGWYINGLNFPGLNPVLELNYYTRYIPTCNSTILISANEPRGYDLTCNWDAPDGGEVTGDCSEAGFVATVTQIDPYHVTVTAVSNTTHISSPVRVMRIFTEVLYDSEPDGDIDGADVADAAASFNGTDTSRLAEEFGMVACQ